MEDFGWVLGRVWRLLAPLGALLGVIFWGLYLEHAPTWLLEASGLHFVAPFSRVWERVLGEFLGPQIAFLLGWVFAFRVLVAGAFRKVWDKIKVP